MLKSFSLHFLPILTALLFIGCTRSDQLIVHHQVIGSTTTNCYLIYDQSSRDAALIDVGGPVDSLLNIIAEKDLRVKYLLLTHGHIDHFLGILEVKRQFQEAQICMNPADIDDIPNQIEWIHENLDSAELAEWQADPYLKSILDYDISSFNQPDIELKDGQVLKLDDKEIKVYHSPGHSPGSVCYLVDDKLFSGDLLFYRRVGRTDHPQGSPEDRQRSVTRLYQLLPDNTTVYPGHGPFTDIGSEKRENQQIRGE